MTVIVSAGRPRALGGPGYPFPAGIQVTGGATGGRIELLAGPASFERIATRQPWVFTVVMKLLWAAARLPLNAYETLGEDGGRRRARGSDLDLLLLRPRPRARGFRLKAPIWWDLLVHGRALVVKDRPGPGQPPTALWPIPWPQVETVADNSGVVGFRVHLPSAAAAIWVAPVDAVYLELPGGSPLEPLARTLRLEDAAIDWQHTSFANGVTPRGAFTTDAKLDDRTMPRLRANLEALYAGPENAGRFGVFDQGLRWSQMGQSAVDAELLGQRRLSREEVCAAYDIPPPLVGILDHATLSNVEVLHNALYVDTLGPRLTMLEDDLNAQLVDDEPAWDGLWVEHNLNELLKPLPETRMRAYLMGQQSSTSTINERRRAENLPPIDHDLADTVMVPANMLPVGVDRPADWTGDGGVPAQGAADAVTASLITARPEETP